MESDVKLGLSLAMGVALVFFGGAKIKILDVEVWVAKILLAY